MEASEHQVGEIFSSVADVDLFGSPASGFAYGKKAWSGSLVHNKIPVTLLFSLYNIVLNTISAKLVLFEYFFKTGSGLKYYSVEKPFRRNSNFTVFRILRNSAEFHGIP